MPRRSTQKLTDKTVRALPDAMKNPRIVYDAEIPGFGIRLTPAGGRAFVLNYVLNKRERRLTIGRFPTWSTKAAREQARVLKRQINLGIDPISETASRESAAIKDHAAPIIADLYARYDTEHLPTKSERSANDDRSMWRDYILPVIGMQKVIDLTPSDVDALHAQISAVKPVRANRVIEVLRKALNLAVRWQWRSDNPASGVRRNRETPRNQYLTPAEILRLNAALDAHPEKISAAAIKLLMLTGARRSEVLRAKWDQFDLEMGVWVKPSSHTKQRREHRVPLSGAAIDLLNTMRTETTSLFVFPGASRQAPLTDVKRTWISACRDAGLGTPAERKNRAGATIIGADGRPEMIWKPRIRLHDLRHTYASILASEGLSLPIIGALLGHTQSQTTARYAHLLDDPLREAAEKASAKMIGSR